MGGAQGGRDQAGVIPRALFDLFAQVSAADRPPVVRMSYLELYNEDLHDLLTETQHTLQARARLVTMSHCALYV